MAMLRRRPVVLPLPVDIVNPPWRCCLKYVEGLKSTTTTTGKMSTAGEPTSPAAPPSLATMGDHSDGDRPDGNGGGAACQGDDNRGHYDGNDEGARDDYNGGGAGIHGTDARPDVNRG